MRFLARDLPCSFLDLCGRDKKRKCSRYHPCYERHLKKSSQTHPERRKRTPRRSNCVRPPHPKGWGMLMGRTPGFLGIVKYPVSYTHLRAHETDSYLVCRLLL